jgi:hypothetical protein
VSYDFYLFNIPAGVAPAEAYKQRFEQQETKTVAKKISVDNQDTSTVRIEQLKLRLAEALILKCPSLKLYERDYARLAKSRSIDESEARRRYRNLDLTDSELGLQVSLFDDTVAIAIPFWRADNEKAEKTLRAAWEYLEILESAGGFTTYDPQAGRILKLDSDFSAILKAYRGLLDTVDRALRNSQ